MGIIHDLKFNEQGLIPAIVTDYNTGTVLMMAYMNHESIEKTIETGNTVFFSRSRNKLWMKGEESGHFQEVKDIFVDCDADTLLIKVEQKGAACHTNKFSCFYRRLDGSEADKKDVLPLNSGAGVLYEVYDVICDRLVNPKEGSYTNYLFNEGLDKMLKKVGEEASEVIIAAKNLSEDEVRYESADLIFHLLVTLKQIGLTPDDVFEELKKRR